MGKLSCCNLYTVYNFGDSYYQIFNNIPQTEYVSSLVYYVTVCRSLTLKKTKSYICDSPNIRQTIIITLP